MNFYNKYILPKYLNLVMRNKDFERCRADVASKASGIALEIGFGSGFNIPYYSSIHKLYALDPSKELYDLAQERVKNVSFPIDYLQASAECIPLTDNILDSVISTWSLCSIPHPEVALMEILRVLKPGGKFFFVEHGKSPRSVVYGIQNFLTPISKKIAGGCHLNRNIEELIHHTGFEIQTIDKFNEKSKPLGFTYKGIAIAKK